jgi:hypothetical protein
VVNKQIVEWIKSKEAKGYDESKLVTYLLKKGYPAGEVKSAIHKVKTEIPFSLTVLISFVVAYAFIIYSLDIIKQGMLALVLFAGFYKATKYLYRIHNPIAIFLLYVVKTAILLGVSLYIGSLFGFSLLISMLTYFKLKKKVTFNDLSTTNFISATYSSAIGLVFCLLIALGIMPFFTDIAISTIFLLLLPLLLVFSLSYFVFNLKILSNTFKIDYEKLYKQAFFLGLVVFAIGALILIIVFAFIAVISVDLRIEEMERRLNFPDYTKKSLISLNMSEGNLIAEELNSEFKGLWDEAREYKIPDPENIFEKVVMFADGTIYDVNANYILFIAKLGVSGGYYKGYYDSAKNLYYAEYSNLKNNYFLDGSKNISGHIDYLNKSVTELYPWWVEEELYRLERQDRVQYMSYFECEYFECVLLKNAAFKMFENSQISNTIQKLGKDLSDLKRHYNKHKIEKMFDEKDKIESAESKALRLFIIQQKMASRINFLCHENLQPSIKKSKACYTKLKSVMGYPENNPYFCNGVPYCLKSLAEDIGEPSICEHARKESFKKACYDYID